MKITLDPRDLTAAGLEALLSLVRRHRVSPGHGDPESYIASVGDVPPAPVGTFEVLVRQELADIAATHTNDLAYLVDRINTVEAAIGRLQRDFEVVFGVRLAEWRRQQGQG